ncbi:hypothetical protein GON26_20245 [Flavobacterium sp. GA093]|uniref:Uncharacterized protein n=1 Tax=Flavobacterium hydrocarbonoxydans TaxID=2683249 RepID=A0A6I4NRF4_9FLAO|nr:hypothetical protein [Flavobacterium hydrocarbonoxydans]MWB96701.1 hypothetical protein [Flavobacterium hydrocarbonoxydans]
MQKLVFGLMSVFCIGFTSFSQTKSIEKGTYISASKGQKIKLNLLDDNKYELVFYSGEYEIKGDSLLFKNQQKTADVFELTYSKDKSIKSKKVKIKFIDAYYSFYLGTQTGTQDVEYQKIKIDYNINPDQTDVTVEIERSDFIYLVYEGYDGAGSVAKYALPKDINDVAVKYTPDLMGDLKISGYFDSKTNELTLGEKAGKNPLVFRSEKEASTSVSNSKIMPLESLVIPNWTYPGKEPLIQDDFGSEVVVDTTVYPPLSQEDVPAKVDFKLKIENNLKEAIAMTKKVPGKYLVVYSNAKNIAVKEEFETFIKDQEIQVGYNFYDGYRPELDRYNFYLASKDDKKWLKNNTIEDDPTIVILDGEGRILAKAKATLESKGYQFSYVDQVCKDLDRNVAVYAFYKVISDKKSTDASLITAFNKVSALELPYSYDTQYTVAENENSGDFKIDFPKLDKKEVSQRWYNLVAAHQKDVKPNMYLVETILKEIKNIGFTKQLFKEEKVLNDADFLAIDYVIKHAAVIETERQAFNTNTDEIHAVGNISSEISKAFYSENYYSEFTGEKIGKQDQKKVASVYKKLIANGNGTFNSYKSYLNYLKSVSATSEIDSDYLKEFDPFFTQFLSLENGNAFEQLDKLLESMDAGSEGYHDSWISFKETCSYMCNESAWSVVVKPEHANFLKNAINWSEYSLVINKNNPYYLDTLAQLYYLDGQKEKAIKTQEQALKYVEAVDELSLADMKEVLEKMQNGTY